MGNVKKTVTEKQLAWYNRASAVLALALCLFSVMIGYIYLNRPTDVNKLRLKFQEAVHQVEEDNVSVLDQYHAILVDTQGKVIYSSIDLYKIGETVNLHMLSYGGNESDSLTHFVTPVVKNQMQVGMLYIEYDLGDENGFPLVLMLPIMIFLWLLLVLILRNRKIHNNMVVPIVHLNQLAGEIARGNYKAQYTYETRDEIGQLCKKIEGLRDELDVSTENEKKLRENEKMLMTSISHDLKTPIATISGFAEGIRDKIAQDEETVHRYAVTIIKKTELLTKLINDIIANTESEDGDIKLHKQELMAKDYIEEVFAGLYPDIENKGLHFVNSKIPNVMITVDPDKMYQVFQNIIGNSIKYTKAGGMITVEYLQRRTDLVVSIKDNGQGIAAADIPYVFDKFYRGERARTQNIGGSGLGLSIVKNIVEKNGGTVECESEAGEGTMISFTIPLA